MKISLFEAIIIVQLILVILKHAGIITFGWIFVFIPLFFYIGVVISSLMFLGLITIFALLKLHNVDKKEITDNKEDK